MNDFKTITAPATPVIQAGICIIRISGDETKDILEKIFISKLSKASKSLNSSSSKHSLSKSSLLKPRVAYFGDIVHPNTSDIIDSGVVIYFKAPFSYTGEDVAELHVHGNPLIVEKILNMLYSLGVEPAEPGEFTKRAFLNGKLDLVQAEAVNDVILSNANEALKLSKENLDGRFSKAVSDIGTPLRDILVQLEANIDFPEEDIAPSSLEKIKDSLFSANQIIKKYIASFNYGQCVKDGFRVLILGTPNAGKSSLLNRLLNKERAIVTDISGTTRDLIEEHATINGLEYIFCDTAGICKTDSRVEKIGIDLAKNKINWANLILLVVNFDNIDESKELYDFLESENKNFWIIQNKIDISDKKIELIKDKKIVKISALKNINIDVLLKELEREVRAKYSPNESSVVVTNERHKSCLERAYVSLSSSIDAIDKNLPIEIVSAELRLALSALEEIIGKTYTEDILGKIFSKFCIGK
ncbi:MAG: tRNA uridine-5-carboxymethylaminomethyl(34) synthesis GTPase MnmE [Bdellovibrionota bacterium]